MVFIEGLLSIERTKHYEDCGFEVTRKYYTTEEAMAAEPDNFDKDAGIGENDTIWVRIFVDMDFKDII